MSELHDLLKESEMLREDILYDQRDVINELV